MPGAYTHLTMVSLLGSPNELLALGGCTKQELSPLLLWTKYFELGAVSPDYPYLDLLSFGTESTQWADTMHYTNVGKRVRAGINEINKLYGDDKYKSLCWLMGFVSHIITDVTIHPVVHLKVGPYQENKTAHRVCEMHQDMFIYPLLGNGDLTQNQLKTGCNTCSDVEDSSKIDPVIQKIWSAMLQHSDPQMYADSPPQIDAWHESFNELVTKSSPTGLFSWSRHMLDNIGVMYPLEVESEYIENLHTPDGQIMDYKTIFCKAEENVKVYWEILLQACIKQEPVDTSCFLNWNLDTGQDENGKITFWEA